jgi:ABC-type dipeptide/oligopeptide/nickel transport system permease component
MAGRALAKEQLALSRMMADAMNQLRRCLDAYQNMNHSFLQYARMSGNRGANSVIVTHATATAMIPMTILFMSLPFPKPID